MPVYIWTCRITQKRQNYYTVWRLTVLCLKWDWSDDFVDHFSHFIQIVLREGICLCLLFSFVWCLHFLFVTESEAKVHQIYVQGKHIFCLKQNVCAFIVRINCLNKVTGLLWKETAEWLHVTELRPCWTSLRNLPWRTHTHTHTHTPSHTHTHIYTYITLGGGGGLLFLVCIYTCLCWHKYN